MRFSLLIALFSLFITAGVAAQTKVVTGVVLLNEAAMPSFKKITQNLSGKWTTKVDSLVINDKTAIFEANNVTVTMAYFDYPDPSDDLMAACGISWLWKNAAQSAINHKAQLVISIIGEERRALEMYMLFARCAAAALESTGGIGVFMNSQYLVLEKGYYLTAAAGLLKQQSVPLYCWVYFGIMEKDGVSGGYTYGMSEFGSPELEIHSKEATMEELHNLLFEVARESVTARRPWKNGDMYTTGTGDKVTLRSATGTYLEGQVLEVKW